MKVTLVGAGPGEKGLLTLKGAQRIREADVVLYDRFVGEDILSMIPTGVEKIDVGKTAGSHPVPQHEINVLLLEKAQAGLNVVRLKGGDPFVFGRGGEELELLRENGIPFEVVPGITAAIAGAAYAGIPVTHRDYASSMHIITGHGKNNEKTSIDYEALVRMGGTLVFMMSVSEIAGICEGCILAGMDKDTPAAIVENATKLSQRKFLGTVETLPGISSRSAIQSPAVIIIGRVCLLSDRYDWYAEKPLRGKRAVAARVNPGSTKLADALRELGCHVTETAPAEIMPLTYPDSPLDKATIAFGSYAWLVLTSAIGVNVFFDYLSERSIDIRSLQHMKVACVGSETERTLRKRGVIADYKPLEYNGEALAHGLCALLSGSEKLLIARASDGAENMTRIFAGANIDFDDVAIYEKTFESAPVQINDADFAAFTSSSAVDSLTRAATDGDFANLKAICIGERTAETARSYGMEVYISEEATIDSMICVALRLFSRSDAYGY